MTRPPHPCDSCPKATAPYSGLLSSSYAPAFYSLQPMQHLCSECPYPALLLLNEILAEMVGTQWHRPKWPMDDLAVTVGVTLCETGEALKKAKMREGSKFREAVALEHVAAMRKEIVQTGAMALRLLVESDFFNEGEK